MEKHLHIISFTIPYPVNYGGVFDLFYKLKALQKQGVLIHLHCYEYGQGEQEELNKYCYSVHYYKRKIGHTGFTISCPYIVSSRSCNHLKNELLKDDHPILMEGIHSTFFINDPSFKKRKLFVRLHNVEHLYYKYLSKSENNIFKKLYYWFESKQLKKYEKAIANKAYFLTVCSQDEDYYKKNFNCNQIQYIPLFLPEWEVTCKEGIGNYCMYHGNLEVAENKKAVQWLLKKVFNKLETPFVIAGKNPAKDLINLAHLKQFTCITANPKTEEMQDMISKAHIHILPSFNKTGIKLKLINALYNCRHCLVNANAVEGTDLESACHVTNTAEGFQNLIAQLYHQPFTEDEIVLRKKILEHIFNNDRNAEKLTDVIFN